MFNKGLIIPIMLSFFFTSCKVKETFLKESFITSDGTYKKLEEFIQLSQPADLIKHVSDIQVYKLVFTEQYFINNGVLQVATIPANSKATTENYIGIQGHRQVLYLVKLIDRETRQYAVTISDTVTGDDKTVMRDTSIVKGTALVFYSMKLTADGDHIGFNSIKAGNVSRKRRSNTDTTFIEAADLVYDIEVENDVETRVKRPALSRSEKRKLFYSRNRYDYQLRITGIKRNEAERYLFVFSQDTEDRLVLEKVVSRHENKIGGSNYLVYKLDEVMPDKQKLEFNLIK
jgi:hypothetical protein